MFMRFEIGNQTEGSFNNVNLCCVINKIANKLFTIFSVTLLFFSI